MKELRNIDLNLLVIFEAIYSARNISHAARLLNMSQPTISNSLGRLRHILDDQLFIRNGNGVEPTSKAMFIILPVRDALKSIKDSVIEGSGFDPEHTSRHFRMVLLDQLEPVLMPHLISQIQDHRSVTLEILHIANTSMVEGLNNGSLDLVLSTFVHEIEEISCEAIGKADVVVVARKNHPLIKNDLSLSDFQALGHVALSQKLRALSRIDEAIKHQNIERHIVYTVNKFWSFPYIISNSDLIGAIPGAFAREVTRYYPLNIFPIPFDLAEQTTYMTWKTSRSDEPAHKWLRAQILTAYDKSTKLA